MCVLWSMLGLWIRIPPTKLWSSSNCRWGTATSKPSASPARSAHSPHGVGRRSRNNINQIAAKKQVGSTTGVNVWELRNLHSFMNLEGWSFWWGLPCITIQDQVGSTACPEDTQHLLVEKRRNPSRHVDSRPAQKQVESDGGWKAADVRFFRSKFDKQMFKLEYLKMANLIIQLLTKHIARTMRDDSWWMETKHQGRLVSAIWPIKCQSKDTFPTWVN